MSKPALAVLTVLAALTAAVLQPVCDGRRVATVSIGASMPLAETCVPETPDRN
jgi:hypothetical protein